MLRISRISGKNTLSIDTLDSSTYSDVNAVQIVSGRIWLLMARRMAITKKHIPEGSAQLYGINLIYSRTIGQRFATSRREARILDHLRIKPNN